MVKLVLEYLFYLLNYVLLILFKYISPLQSKQISKFGCCDTNFAYGSSDFITNWFLTNFHELKLRSVL
jgi:hypothetical protein